MSKNEKQPPHTLPSLPITPRRAPSTPHGIRALQQRTEGRRKSANVKRPDSARHILRQLAKVTAAQTKRRSPIPQTKPSTPIDKGNAFSPFMLLDDEDLENGEGLERPSFTLPIEELDEDIAAGEAPERRELPGGDDYTFKSVDFAALRAKPPTSVQSERIRRMSRISFLPLPGEEDGGGPEDGDDLTAQSIEYGRRAVSDGPAWDRYPRSSFGSIRMSEFGLDESRLGKVLEQEQSLIPDHPHGDMGGDVDDETELEEGYTLSCNYTDAIADKSSAVTEDLMSEPVEDGIFITAPGFADDENTFRLDLDGDKIEPEDRPITFETEDRNSSAATADALPSEPSRQSPNLSPQSPHTITRQVTTIEAAASPHAPRPKKLKLTRKGNTVPALPSSLVKRTAIDSMTRIGKRRPTVSRESLAALEQATEWFFEQVGEDLEAYSDHAKRRKRIDDTDVITLMKRQRVIGRGRTLAELAQEFLPDKVLLDLHLPDEA